MTNTPGWASPGSSGSPEPGNGDSPDDTPRAPQPDTGDATPDPAAASDAAPGTPEAVNAPSAPENAGSDAATPPAGNWSRQQPPAGTWQASATPDVPGPALPTSLAEQSAPPAAPVPPQPGPGQGGWGQQWTPPPAPGPDHGGPRWGPQAPSYGPPPIGWAPVVPAAPRPGVVPLRPLDAGEILSGAFATFRAHWRTAMALVFGVAVLTEGINAVVNRYLIDDGRLDDLKNESDPTLGDIAHALGGSAGATFLVMLTSMIGGILTSGLLTVVVSRAVLGRSVTLRASWQEARPRLPQLIGLALLLPLALVAVIAVAVLPGALVAWSGSENGGVALASLGIMAATVVCVRQWVLWGLAAPALVLEKQGIRAAVKRSVKLVRGSWWRVVGVQLLVALVTGIVSLVIGLAFTAIANAVGNGNGGLFSTDGPADWPTVIITAVGGIIASALTLPVSASAISLLYVDQRIRREALDIDLARAANVPGYQAPATASDVRR
ncbi:hypothetical protein [Streptomyces sp. NRRL F-5123]|uniref:hypothetical protein n=1 Tax=Streptomyces sp. NRRL F-5123 TaxID=1463856 RepID=UPI0004E23FEE|nr:hypothetical protein [Streptomyces sp. NRRL F-5123]